MWSLCLPKEIFFSVYRCTRPFKYQFVYFRRRSHVLFLKLHDRKLNSVLFFLLWLPTSQTGFGNHLTSPVLKPACCFRIDSGFSRHLCAWRGVSVYSHVTAHVGVRGQLTGIPFSPISPYGCQRSDPGHGAWQQLPIRTEADHLIGPVFFFFYN